MPFSKNIDLTRILSLTTVVLAIFISLVYFLLLGNYEVGRLILTSSVLFIVPYIVNLLGYKNFSRVLFSYLTPAIILVLSVMSKRVAIEAGDINSDSYFDIRLILLVTMIIPFASIELSERKLLIISILPSLLSICFFDPIHIALGVGFYEAGLESEDYYISGNLYSHITYIFTAVAFIFLKKQSQTSEKRYLRKSEKLQNYLDKIVDQSRSPSIQNGQIDKVAKEILEKVVLTMNVTRASIWRYQKETNWIECISVIEKGEFTSCNRILDCDDAPAYIHEIKQKKILLADDSFTHPALSEMTDYLKQNSILSMMDVPYFHDGELGGVICLEHQYEKRHWSTEDTIFVKALSDLLSYTIITEKLTRQYEIIKEKSDEINAINEHLESRITVRTKELEDKNEQLSEYAFLNSHKLRGPIARIEGLFNVLELTQNDRIPQEILQPIRDSINELDQVSRQINRSIEHYGKMTPRKVEEVISKN